MNSTHRLLKASIWLYFILLVLEGVLRKWIMPGLSNPLLIVRDPVVLLIYALALGGNIFPWRPGVLVLGGFIMLSLLFSVLVSIPVEVAIFGLRINYVHIPLVFVMAAVFDRRDVIRFGQAVLWLSVPIVILMFMQYNAGSGSWLNVGAGGGIDGQIEGAMGKFRPAGPFSFASGPVAWFSLAMAFVFYGWVNRGVYSRWLLIAATCTIVLAAPISISRSLVLSVLVVGAFGVISLLLDPKRITALVIPLLLVAAAFNIITENGLTDAFESRWDASTGSEGFKSSIVMRLVSSYTSAFDVVSETPIWGHGIGLGSNVGSRMATGKIEFVLSETEWAKILLELGPFLGSAYIIYRCWLAGLVAWAGLTALLREKDSLAWLLSAACFLPILSGQWGPPTNLGMAVFGGGLVLAAAKPMAETEDEGMADETADDEGAEDETETENARV